MTTRMKGATGWTIAILLVLSYQVVIYRSVLWPTYEWIDPWDESLYLQSGKLLLDGVLPSLSLSPLVAGFYAVILWAMGPTTEWMTSASSIGRIILFSLLWLSTYQLARLWGQASQKALVLGIMVLSPWIISLILNSSHALFAVCLTLALTGWTLFLRTPKGSFLLGASSFLGLAVLCRTEAILVLLGFWGLVLARIGLKRLPWRWVPLAIAPPVLLLGAFAFFYGQFMGEGLWGTKERSYFVFEQGHSFAWSSFRDDPNEYMSGMADARTVFGHPHDHDFSVVRAVWANPAAFLSRIPRLALKGIIYTAEVWGLGVFLLMTWMITRGFFAMFKQGDGWAGITVIVWISFVPLYLMLCHQRTHWAILFPILLPVALYGWRAEGLALSKESWWRWIIGLVLLGVGLAIMYPFGWGAILSAALLLGGMTWLRLRDTAVSSTKLFVWMAILALLIPGTMTMARFPHERAPPDPTVPSLLALREEFSPGTLIASYAPGRLWAADMTWLPLDGIWDHIINAAHLVDWMKAQGAVAIYADGQLLMNEQDVFVILRDMAGGHARVVLQDPVAGVAILRLLETD